MVARSNHEEEVMKSLRSSLTALAAIALMGTVSVASATTQLSVVPFGDPQVVANPTTDAHKVGAFIVVEHIESGQPLEFLKTRDMRGMCSDRFGMREDLELTLTYQPDLGVPGAHKLLINGARPSAIWWPHALIPTQNQTISCDILVRPQDRASHDNPGFPGAGYLRIDVLLEFETP